jgi:hypothetical protein
MKASYVAYALFFFVVGVAGAGCKKAVEVGPPPTYISSASVFKDDNTATAAQLNLYAQMATDPWNYHIITAMSSDEYQNYSTNQYYLDVYTNAVNAQTDAATFGIWAQTFNYLYKANSILEGIQGSPGMTQRVKQQLTGESLFMRAYWYFYLVNFYGDVPLLTSTDYKANLSIARTPQTKVYQQIVQDLQRAEELLGSNYVDATDTTITIDRVRPTSWAAAALLARTYLYLQNWAGADSAASVVIGSPKYGLSPLSGAGSVFTMNSQEAIWQLLPNAAVPNATTDGYFTILSADPSSGLNNCSTVSVALMNAFEPGDQRAVNWIGQYTDGTGSYLFPFKYKSGANATSLSEYTMILRLGEQVLIRAEARTQEGNVSGALADLNAIRNRAGLGNYGGATDKASLLNAILHERQVELFSEGHRWFDLKRTGMVNSVLGAPGNVCQAKGGTGWNASQELYPIPLTDIQTDPNLVQNPGY